MLVDSVYRDFKTCCNSSIGISSSMSASMNLLRLDSSDTRGVMAIDVIGETLPLYLLSIKGGIESPRVVGVGGMELDRFV